MCIIGKPCFVVDAQRTATLCVRGGQVWACGYWSNGYPVPCWPEWTPLWGWYYRPVDSPF